MMNSGFAPWFGAAAMLCLAGAAHAQQGNAQAMTVATCGSQAFPLGTTVQPRYAPFTMLPSGLLCTNATGGGGGGGGAITGPLGPSTTAANSVATTFGSGTQLPAFAATPTFNLGSGSIGNTGFSAYGPDSVGVPPTKPPVLNGFKDGSGNVQAVTPSTPFPTQQIGVSAVGNTGGLVSASFSRPNNTTTYASGALVANSTTAASVVPLAFPVARTPGGAGRITGICIAKSTNVVANSTFALQLYLAAPTSTVGDGGTWANATSGALTYLGSYPIAVTTQFTDGAKGCAGAPADGSAYYTFQAQAGSQQIYALITTTAGYAPGANETFTATLAYDQNFQ